MISFSVTLHPYSSVLYIDLSSQHIQEKERMEAIKQKEQEVILC